MDVNGELAEHRAKRNCLKQLHYLKLSTPFSNGRRKRDYNPDNVFVSQAITHTYMHEKYVAKIVPHTQFGLIVCKI